MTYICHKSGCPAALWPTTYACKCDGAAWMADKLDDLARVDWKELGRLMDDLKAEKARAEKAEAALDEAERRPLLAWHIENTQAAERARFERIVREVRAVVTDTVILGFDNGWGEACDEILERCKPNCGCVEIDARLAALAAEKEGK